MSLLEGHYGVRDGVWHREAEEKFARHLERYFRDGKAPSRELNQLFARFKDWMEQVYRRLQGSPIEAEIHPEIREAMNRMFTVRDGTPDLRRMGGRNRDAFRASLFEASDAAQIPRSQAEAVLEAWDARARSWASRGPRRTPEEFYARYGAVHRTFDATPVPAR